MNSFHKPIAIATLGSILITIGLLLSVTCTRVLRLCAIQGDVRSQGFGSGQLENVTPWGSQQVRRGSTQRPSCFFTEQRQSISNQYN